MGSASGKLGASHKDIAYKLGAVIAEKGCITITGACPGFPLEPARGASENGGLLFCTNQIHEFLWKSSLRIIYKINKPFCNVNMLQLNCDHIAHF
jgi:hypothetical protein